MGKWMAERPIENIISLDLEMNQPSNSIIQVGYVVGNILTGEILKEVSEDIWIDEKISEDIIKLTGVTQERVNAGALLPDVYEGIAEDHSKFNCFANPLTWGGGDSILLKEQLGDPSRYVFGRRWIDCKTLYISYAIANNLKWRGGLAKTMLRFNMNFDGRKHDAMHDARNTFLLYRKLLDEIGKK